MKTILLVSRSAQPAARLEDRIAHQRASIGEVASQLRLDASPIVGHDGRVMTGPQLRPLTLELGLRGEGKKS